MHHFAAIVLLFSFLFLYPPDPTTWAVHLPTELEKLLAWLNGGWGIAYGIALCSLAAVRFIEKSDEANDGLREFRKEAAGGIGLLLAMVPLTALGCLLIDRTGYRYVWASETEGCALYQPVASSIPVGPLGILLVLLMSLQIVRILLSSRPRHVALRSAASHPIWLLSPLWGAPLAVMSDVVVESLCHYTASPFEQSRTLYFLMPVVCLILHDLVTLGRGLGKHRPRAIPLEGVGRLQRPRVCS